MDVSVWNKTWLIDWLIEVVEFGPYPTPDSDLSYTRWEQHLCNKMYLNWCCFCDVQWFVKGAGNEAVMPSAVGHVIIAVALLINVIVGYML